MLRQSARVARADAARGQCPLGRGRPRRVARRARDRSARAVSLVVRARRRRLRRHLLRLLPERPAVGAAGSRRRPARIRAQRRAAPGRARLSGAAGRARLLRNQQRQMAVAATSCRTSGRRTVRGRSVQRQPRRGRCRRRSAAAAPGLGTRAGVGHRCTGSRHRSCGGRAHPDLGLGLVVPRHRRPKSAPTAARASAARPSRSRAASPGGASRCRGDRPIAARRCFAPALSRRMASRSRWRARATPFTRCGSSCADTGAVSPAEIGLSVTRITSAGAAAGLASPTAVMPVPASRRGPDRSGCRHDQRFRPREPDAVPSGQVPCRQDGGSTFVDRPGPERLPRSFRAAAASARASYAGGPASQDEHRGLTASA